MVLGWNNPSVGHVYDAVGYAVHRRVVGHDDECLSEVAAQVGYERAYLVAVCGVETSCRLVGKHYLRTVDQSAGYGCALPFTPRHPRRLVAQTVPKSEMCEQFFGARHSLLLCRSCDEGRHRGILDSGEFRQKLMELKYETDVAIPEFRETPVVKPCEILAVVADGSAVGTVERPGNLQQGGLAGSTWSHDGYYLILTYVDADISQNLQVAIGFANIPYLNHFVWNYVRDCL